MNPITFSEKPSNRAVHAGLALAAFMCIVSLSGCGNSLDEDLPKTAPASGIVLYNGEPIEGALVTFHPQGQGNPATGRTQANGRFVLTTYEAKDGAVVGTHVVTVELFPEGGLPGQEVESTGATPIPDKYADPSTSPLSEQVEADAANDFELQLED